MLLDAISGRIVLVCLFGRPAVWRAFDIFDSENIVRYFNSSHLEPEKEKSTTLFFYLGMGPGSEHHDRLFPRKGMD